MKITKQDVQQIIDWIRDWFQENGKDCKAVVGISGGKDSTIVAALCWHALGKDRVVGVRMPCGYQEDLNIAREVCDYLDIESVEINIYDAVQAIITPIKKVTPVTQGLTNQMLTNLPARVRMATLYAVAQNLPCGGRVANTCNFSEDYVGYSTKYGDMAGDFAPLQDFTVDEVRQIGTLLDLPEELVFKAPSDGLCGKTDEDNLGFTYEQLDYYLEYGQVDEDENEIVEKIKKRHQQNLFKLQPMPTYTRLKNGRVV